MVWTAPRTAARRCCSSSGDGRGDHGGELVATGRREREVASSTRSKLAAARRRGRPGGPGARVSAVGLALEQLADDAVPCCRRRPGGRSARRAARGCRRRSARSGTARPPPGRPGRRFSAPARIDATASASRVSERSRSVGPALADEVLDHDDRLGRDLAGEQLLGERRPSRRPRATGRRRRGAARWSVEAVDDPDGGRDELVTRATRTRLTPCRRARRRAPCSRRWRPRATGLPRIRRPRPDLLGLDALRPRARRGTGRRCPLTGLLVQRLTDDPAGQVGGQAADLAAQRDDGLLALGLDLLVRASVMRAASVCACLAHLGDDLRTLRLASSRIRVASSRASAAGPCTAPAPPGPAAWASSALLMPPSIAAVRSA